METQNLNQNVGSEPGGATGKSPRWALVIREITDEDREMFPVLTETAERFALFQENYYDDRTEVDLIASSDDKEFLETIKEEASGWEE